MAIIMYLYENDNLIETLSHNKRIGLWNHYYRNPRCTIGTVNCKLLELGMFGSCKSSINSYSGGSGSDSFFPFVFSRNKNIMTIFDIKPKDVREIESTYIVEDQITSLM